MGNLLKVSFFICAVLIQGNLAAYSRNKEQDTVKLHVNQNDVFATEDLDFGIDTLRAILDDDRGKLDLEMNYERSTFLATWIHLRHKISRSPKLKADLDRRVKEAHTRDFVFGPPTFTCGPSKSSTPPTSVHQLRPGDINVIAAMGDSVTAGFGVGADNLLEVFDQNRGDSWSVGADQHLNLGVITLATVIQEFNSELRGYSTCTSQPGSLHGWLNVAVGGATNVQMPNQAQNVVDWCREDNTIDFNNDWKLVTILIGGNDLCRACTNPQYNTTNYVDRIRIALDTMHAQLPRTMVNLVPMFDVTPVGNFSDGLVCDVIQRAACPCGIREEYKDSARPQQLAYYNGLQALLDTGRYDDDDSFTVVIQPMMVDMKPPIDPDTGFYDKTFLSHDCFHPSLKAHQMFAYITWNTMLTRESEKTRNYNLYEENPTFKCPTQDNPFIFTRGNSI